MKPTLTFVSADLQVAPLGPVSCVPDLLGFANLQNKTQFALDDTDEIYEGYGRLSTAYPYRQYTCYTRACETRPVKTAVLDNGILRAVFLPELGGRLWSLTDLRTGKNLLYTNDVIRPGNLAVRNAWFSGGVEWNIGVIGHTPLTMDPLFTAQLTNEQGCPVLRMYEYERIRSLTYQMDFWLEEGGSFLNCRMRVENRSADVTPMYWWSNMAVPEYEGGRVLAPADEAFTSSGSHVSKVSIPMVDGIDVSRYCDIPYQVDYFFHLRNGRVPYIANLDAQGNGLVHLSTRRLQSRKLFSWGNSGASARWQEFLTKDAGRYVEIQAGLGKTQYGCIPMAPHTAWEWLEQYGAVSLGAQAITASFGEAEAQLGSLVEGPLEGRGLEKILESTHGMAKTPAVLVSAGSGYGALENARRAACGEQTLPEHLDFSSRDSRQKEWKHLLVHGKLPRIKPAQQPADFMAGEFWHKALENCVKGSDSDNWYAWYQLGVLLLHEGHRKEAKKALKRSCELCENPWALHALSVVALQAGKNKRAVRRILHGLRLRGDDLAYCKEAFRILTRAGAYPELLDAFDALPSALAEDGRLRLCRVEALYYTGHCREAYRLLTDGSGLVTADLREGEDTIGQLWTALHRALYGKPGEIPHFFDFNSLPPAGKHPEEVEHAQ